MPVIAASHAICSIVASGASDKSRFTFIQVIARLCNQGSSSGRQRDSIMGPELACPYFKTVPPFEDADILELYHNLAKLIR